MRRIEIPATLLARADEVTFSLARFSPAFLVLKAYDVGIDASFVPLRLVVMYLIYGRRRLGEREQQLVRGG